MEEKYGLNKKQLSNLELKQIIQLDKYSKVKRKKLLSAKTINDKLIQLPFIISSPDDIFVCSIRHVKPNFITDKIVKSEIIELNKKEYAHQPKNKLVLIENADPGYDWIFGYKIKGLITKHGGVNSHIRCQELNIPAVIGVGETTII